MSLSSLTDSGPLNDAGDVLAAIDAARIADGSSDVAPMSSLAENALPDQNSERMSVNTDPATAAMTPTPSVTSADGAIVSTTAAPAADETTDTPRPRLTFGRGRTSSQSSSVETTTDVGSSSGSRLRQSISDTRQQIRNTVGGITKSVTDVTKRLTKAATGGGSDNDDDTDNNDSSVAGDSK